MPDYAALNRQALGLSKRRTLITPEGVDLQLSLADGGQRVGAFMLDLALHVRRPDPLTISLGISSARSACRARRSASSSGCSASSCSATSTSSSSR